MLYQLLFALHDDVSWLRWLNVLRYTSTRILFATLTALILSLILYPWFIRTLQKIQLGQVVREDGPKSHFSKRGTPTMGGSLILFTLIIPTVLWSDMSNGFVLLATAVTAGYGVIGFIDDSLKIRRKSSGGLPGRIKLLLQFIVAGAAVWYLFDYSGLHAGDDPLPPRDAARPTFISTSSSCRRGCTSIFATLVIVGFSNAVNLTDGLDGLAIGPVVMSRRHLLDPRPTPPALLIAGFDIARYLNIPHIPGVGELAVYCGAMMRRRHRLPVVQQLPGAACSWATSARSPLGAGIGFLAVASKNEFTLVIVGGMFVLEAVSVIVQVDRFKLTGKRVFKMAPIHHHFELKGWSEPKVIVRFWIISIMLALVGLATLKLR